MHPRFESDLRHIYEESADSLSADRQTRSLPVALAETFFIGGWAIALVKAAATDPNSTNWPNIEIHSVAFSGLYLWVTCAVIIASVIGSSQTQASIPRLLQAFEYHLAEGRAKHDTQRPSKDFRDEIGWCRTGQQRAIYAGLSSWRPTKWTDRSRSFHTSAFMMAGFVGAALIIVGTSYAAAIVLSHYVPPQGPTCRHVAESMMYVDVPCFSEMLR